MTTVVTSNNVESGSGSQVDWWGWVIVALVLSGVYLLGYKMAKGYWYERGYYDGQDAADRYIRNRTRQQQR